MSEPTDQAAGAANVSSSRAKWHAIGVKRVRPPAFGLAGFFLPGLVRAHAASLNFLPKKVLANTCEFFARLRGAMEIAAWTA